MYNQRADKLGDAIRSEQSTTLGSQITVPVPERIDVEKPVSDRLRTAIAEGWRPTYTLLFGTAFVDALADHHAEAIAWHFESRVAFLENRKPDYLAYFPIWPRGHMKTTIAEHMAVVDGVLSLAFGQPGFCLFIGREKTKVLENITNIETLLSSGGVLLHAPSLSRVARNEETDRNRQWTGTFLHTAAGYVYKGGSIESSQAGSRIEKTRPTWIILDDIDGREDSPQITQTRLKRLTGEIIPMRQGNTLIYFAQNLISRFTVMYKIHTQQEKVLTNRKPTKPIPAVLNPVFGQRTVDGIMQDYLISGESTWHVWDTDRINDEIQSEGLPAFEAECQHDVAQARVGLFHKAYNDDVHPISYSQFAAIYGRADAWKDWNKVVANDWARTKTKFHANVAGYLAVSSANTIRPGHTFLVPLSFPEDVGAADVADRLLSELTPFAYGEEGNRKTWRNLIDEAWKRTNAHQHFETIKERIDYEKNYYSRLIPKYARTVLAAYRVRSAVMSHSEDKIRELFNQGFGFNFEPANPGKTDALESIDEAMKVDYEADHIFKPGMKGYTRWNVLCPDDRTQIPEIVNGIEVYPPVPFPEVSAPDDLHDSDLFRYQMCNRRFKAPKLTIGGELIDVPEKSDDDFGQMLQMVYFKGLLTNLKLTKDEKEELAIAPKFRLDAINQQKDEVSEAEYGQLLITRQAKLVIPKILNGTNKPKGRFAKFQR